METIEKSVEILNDLIEINNDRAAGFAKASKDLDGNDSSLQGIFNGYEQESRRFSQELKDCVNQLGGEPDNSKSASGTIHRAWIDVKSTFGGNDRKSMLEECERGEDAIKKAYRDALSSDTALPADIMAIVTRQQESIIASHDKIKALRNSA